MDVDKLGWVKASSYRKDILNSLEKPKTPKELSEDTGYYLSHVSSTLSDLKSKDIVECLNPDRRKGKLYSITEEGIEIRETL